MFELAYKYVRSPTSTYYKIEEERPWKLSIIIVVLGSLSTNLLGSVTLKAILSSLSLDLDIPLYYPYFNLSFFFAPILSIVNWLIWSLLIAGVTRLIFRPTVGNWQNLAISFGLSHSPFILLAPVATFGLILHATLGSSFPTSSIFFLYTLCSIGVLVWVLILQILSLKLSYQFSLGKALVAYLLPCGIVTLCFLLLFFLLFLILGAALISLLPKFFSPDFFR